MAPAAPATARRASAAPQPQSRPTRRPPLRIFQPEPRKASRRGLSRRGHLWLAVTLVVGSLLVVVIADAMVTQGQVRLTAVQSSIANQLTIQKAAQSDVAERAAPDQVVAEAIADGMVAPQSVTDLPEVPLNVPLPIPDTSAAPASTNAATSTTHAAATSPTTTATTAPTAR